jgi:hypothetical protein
MLISRRALSAVIATILSHHTLPPQQRFELAGTMAPAAWLSAVSALEVSSRSEEEMVRRSLYAPPPQIQSYSQQVRASPDRREHKQVARSHEAKLVAG